MKDKEPFEFVYTVPWLDWYDTKKVKIDFNDYDAFKLVRRFGPSWWLIGINYVDYPKFHREEIEIGELASEHCNRNLKSFIEWAKTERGSKLVEISVISASFDLIKEISEIIKS